MVDFELPPSCSTVPCARSKKSMRDASTTYPSRIIIPWSLHFVCRIHEFVWTSAGILLFIPRSCPIFWRKKKAVELRETLTNNTKHNHWWQKDEPLQKEGIIIQVLKAGASRYNNYRSDRFLLALIVKPSTNTSPTFTMIITWPVWRVNW